MTRTGGIRLAEPKQLHLRGEEPCLHTVVEAVAVKGVDRVRCVECGESWTAKEWAEIEEWGLELDEPDSAG